MSDITKRILPISSKSLDHQESPLDSLPELSVSYEKKKQEVKVQLILTKHRDLPAWLQDSHFIQTGYRVEYSLTMCLRSIFHLHNETYNIWTHLLGFLFFFSAMIAILWTNWLKDATSMDLFILCTFLVAAQAQMLFSSIFHTFYCNSHSWSKTTAKLDYTGISVMIVGSYFPPLYYGFYCHPYWQTLYIGTITLLGVIGTALSMFDMFSTPKIRPFRVGFFLVFGCFALIPVPHLYALGELNRFQELISFEALMGIFYLVGTFFYASRFPESRFPGKFDIHPLSSHAIWHYFTIAAAMTQLYVSIRLFEIHQQIPCGTY